MFDMKNPKFFAQLDGSIRNIPQALGTIDTTVSDKKHILWKLYKSRHKVKSMFFSHRESRDLTSSDFWSPKMTQDQLDDYKEKLPPSELNRYFRNVWDDDSSKLITDTMLLSGRYFGSLENTWNPSFVIDVSRKISELERDIAALNDVIKTEEIDEDDKPNATVIRLNSKRESCKLLYNQLYSVNNIYSIHDSGGYLGGQEGCSIDDLDKLSSMLRTDWVILVGLDRNDPASEQAKSNTAISVIAKGLVGSRDPAYKARLKSLDAEKIPDYVYLLLRLYIFQKNSAALLKDIISNIHHEFDGIDKLTSERWAMFDIHEWCLEQGIESELISATYAKQREIFVMLYTTWNSGYFKYPTVNIPGANGPDILEEEASNFINDPVGKFYGSDSKGNVGGIQDDSMYAIGEGIYGGRMLGVDSMRIRKSLPYFGTMVMPNRSPARLFL